MVTVLDSKSTSGPGVYDKGHGREGPVAVCSPAANIRVLLSIYFQLPPTKTISGNWALDLWRYPPNALSGLTAIGHSPALPVSLVVNAVPLG